MEKYINKTLNELLPYSNDHDSWYWIGMAYFGRQDWKNAAEWLTKAMNDSGNTMGAKAANDLAGMHIMGVHPNASKDEAVRIFEGISQYAMAKIQLGFLYHDYKGQRIEGKDLIEKGIEQLKSQNNGSDEYLNQLECFTIAEIFRGSGENSKAVEYYRKAAQRCDVNYQVEREMKEDAE